MNFLSFVKIKIIIFFILGLKQYINCQVVCNGWIDSDSQNSIIPCGTNIDNPCQTIDQAVETCGNYDTINLYFTQTLKPFQISEKGSFNSINNKTINLYNINKNNQSIIIDLSLTTAPFIDITSNGPSNTNFIRMYGFTFTNQNHSSVIKMINSNLNVEISNCNFVNNTLRENGLFYFLSGPNSNKTNVGEISIKNSKFINNVGNNYSMIYSDYDSLIDIDECSFKNISSNKEGAVLDLEKGYTTITNSIFEQIILNGKVSGSGNIIFIGSPQPTNNNYKITLRNLTFSDCSTGYGIIITSQYYTITMDRLKFISNYNFLSIGAFNSIVTDINISNCLFEDNSFLFKNDIAKGGTIALINSPATITNSTFNLNTARGGAIYITGNLLTKSITIDYCVFLNCSGVGSNGQSIYINSSTSVAIKNSKFYQSFNNLNSSEIYCQSTSLILSTLQQNNSSKLLSCSSDTSCNINKISDKQYYDACDPSNQNSDHDNDDDDDNHHNKLRPAQIFGIVVGSIVVVFILFIICILIFKKVKKNQNYIPIK
ncbi:hypothetical protein RB653_002861 [Dictyostelium firmibasis]|uniref:Right handed beta helix domain-containing protein n=1 Tax=Dictyostelium firmibasis TaxID=79012 RepID=A0AAN7TYI9_9MYCE